jgi:glycosyltransferase involved in cell wall biosynthesis
MKVSIAISTWNRCELLRLTLDRMLELRIPAGVEWELLIVNNNCTDGTDAVVATFEDRLPLRLLHEPTPGLSHARNAALAVATGEFLLQTDDDALVAPDWVEAMLAAFSAHRADLVFGRVYPWWEGAAPRWFSPLYNGLFALVDMGEPSRLLEDHEAAGAGVNHGFRMSALRSIGTYRTDLGQCQGTGGGEDSEMFERAFSRGLRVAWAPDAVVTHYIPEARCSKRFFRQRTWDDSLAHLRMLKGAPASAPRLLGLPRHFVRTNLTYLRRWLAAWTGDEGARLFYELKLIRFAGLLWNLALRRT